jgi:hypothetical protein
MTTVRQFINLEELHQAFLDAGTNDPANDADRWIREQVALLIAECDPQLFAELEALAPKVFVTVPPMGLAIVQMLWYLVENNDIFNLD